MARKHTLKLTPYPSVLVLSLDQTPFQKGEYKDAIGLTTKSGSWLQININLENDKATQAGAVVHESAHAVQMLEEVVSTKFDMETFAYMVQHIATWTLEKLGLLPS